MATNITNIDSGTAIHDFPDIYNKNNKELLTIIQTLQKEITELKESHTEDMKKLKSDFTQWKTNLENEFDSKMNEFEKSFVTKDKYEDDVIKYYTESKDFKTVVKSIIDENK